MKIDAEELARIREDGALRGLRDSLRCCLTNIVWQVEQLTKKEYATRADLRASMAGVRSAVKDAEAIADELEKNNSAMIDTL